jgi:hypothetical protein
MKLMKHNTIFLILILGAIGQSLLAQENDGDTTSFINQPIRLEYEIDKKDQEFHVISAGENGLMLATQTSNKSPQGFLWNINMLDSALETTWINSIPIEYGMYLRGYDYSLNHIFLLFGVTPYRQEDLFLLRFNVTTGDTTSFKINTVFPIELSNFEVVDNTIVIGGYTNERPVVLTYNTYEQKARVLPGYYTNNSQILDIITDDDLRTFTVLRTQRLPDKRSSIGSTVFNDLGEEIQEFALNPGEDRSLIDGTSTLIDDGTQYVAGTYAHRRSDYSRGLYVAKVDGEKQILQYHNYADLTNFFSYMRAGRENRVKERINRRKIKGQKLRFNYRLIIHDIIERDNEYILVGEAYYPKYSSTSNNSPYSSAFGNGGAPMRNLNNYIGFLGYKYTHAVVVAFDKVGKVKWDNSFEINDVLSQSLDKFVKISIEEDRVVLLYIYEGIIRSKIVSGNEILEGKAFDNVKLKFASDELKDSETEVEGLENWYDKTFYAYGIQNIRNLKDENVKMNRRIFYINKITYK